MKKFANFLIRRTPGWLALASAVVFLVFTALVLPGQSATMASYSGDASSPDLSLFYSPAALYNMAETYGPAGRTAYVHARFSFDLLFPLVYGIFLTSGIAWLLGELTAEGSPWRLLALLPTAAVLFDLLENSAASLVIARYPLRSPLPAALAPFFTFVKWICVGGSFLLLGGLLITLLVKKFKNV